MKDYEGPVFNDGTKKSEKRHFGHPSSRMDSGKSRFEPAYKVKNTKADLQHAEESHRVQDVKNKQENKIEETLKQSEPKSGLEHYEIPFLKNQNKTLSSIKTRSYTDTIEVSGKGNKIGVGSSEKVYNGHTERTSYKPTYQQRVKQESASQKFKTTELPKPYKAPDKTDDRVDENTRLLAKRLLKSKNSFLLFEN